MNIDLFDFLNEIEQIGNNKEKIFQIKNKKKNTRN